MLKRLVSLLTLSVLVGAIVLSAPTAYGGSVQPAKAKTTFSTSTPAKISFVSGFKMYLRLWLGLPPLRFESKPPVVKDGPQKSSTGSVPDPRSISAPTRDHGSSGSDI